ncbi:putative signal transducing protein [Coraliomargarita sp. W4R53]
MQEVYSHHDSSTVGLIDGILRESGIPTLLKNWTGGNITEIPIPSLYPSIHVLNDSQAEEAKRIIKEYLSQDIKELPEWICPNCQSTVDGYLSECWSCQTER